MKYEMLNRERKYIFFFFDDEMRRDIFAYYDLCEATVQFLTFPCDWNRLAERTMCGNLFASLFGCVCVSDSTKQIENRWLFTRLGGKQIFEIIYLAC